MIRTRSLTLAALAAALGLAGAPVRAAAPTAVMTKAGCLVCHAEDKPVLGPSLKEIAARNKGKDAAAVLTRRVRAGSTGVYGKVPMPATGPDKLSDADLAAVIDHILKR